MVAQSIPTPWTTVMLGVLVATGLLQVMALTASVEAGAVSMRWLQMGQWWRLFTAPVLHGGVLHWFFNVAVLESLGRMMERRVPRAWLPVTFLLAALAGGAASVLLPPDGTSVGSSGGLMGVFGFLVVTARRRAADFPDGFSRMLLINIALIGVVGGIAYAYIDNAAHAGGLAAGLLIGLIAVPRAGRTPRWTGGAGLEWAGRLALGVIIASAAAAIFVTLRLFAG